MQTLENIIDCRTAPLTQWEPVVGEAPSEGKRKEDRLTHTAVAQALWTLNAQHITGIIADEARQELAIAAQNEKALRVTHLTLPGAFGRAARNNFVDAVLDRHPGVSKVTVTTNADFANPDLYGRKQDAVVLNMILGCLATPEDPSNIHKMLTFTASLLDDQGSLLIVRPNPAGGEFETYKCVTPAAHLKGGESYDFIVKGLEDYGPMKNLYTPDDFLKAALDKAGFTMGETRYIADAYEDETPEKAPFLMNVCSLRPTV